MEDSDTGDEISENASAFSVSYYVKDLDEFLEDNLYLFTLIGIFGAVTIYLRQAGLPSTEPGIIPYENFVFAGGFGIIILLVGILSLKLWIGIWPEEGRILVGKNMPFIIFFLLLFFLFLPVLAHVSSYNRVWAAFYLLLFYLGGFVTKLGFVDYLIENNLHERVGATFSISRFKGLALIEGTIALLAYLTHVVANWYYGEQFVNRIISSPDIVNHLWLYLLLQTSSIWFIISVGMVVLAGYKGYSERKGGIFRKISS